MANALVQQSDLVLSLSERQVEILELVASGVPRRSIARRLSISENTGVTDVVLDPRTRRPDYDDARLTENTRAAYPVEHIDNADLSGCGGHPRHVVFLTCDAFGVLPPLCRLTVEQALYHFLSGYTAKVAGTERGVREPEATFSACFAAPFLPLEPTRYAELLANPARVNEMLDLFWIGIGTEDAGHPNAVRLHEYLTAKSIEHTFRETPGAHTWIVWREYLNEFAPQLFQ